jgi:hypothetical protein
MPSIQTHPDTDTNSPIPAGFAPEGIAEAQMPDLFDENTRYLLQALPARYRAIFVHLLHYATLDPRSTLQYSLFRGLGESHDEAIILYKSVQQLAKTPDSPAGPETYLKALLLYEALHILHRRFHRGYTEIRLPLGKREIRIPELLQSLRQLHESYANVKVKQLARKTAKVIQSEAFQASIPRPVTSLEADLKAVLTRLLEEHGIGSQQIRPILVEQTCTALVEALGLSRSGSVGAKAGAAVARSDRETLRPLGDLESHAGAFPALAGCQTAVGRDVGAVRLGEFQETESPTKRPRGHKQRGCGLHTFEGDAQMGEESSLSPKFGRGKPRLGDSKAFVSISGSSLSREILEEEPTLLDSTETETPKTPAYVDPRPHQEIVREVQVYKQLFDRRPGRKWDGSLYNTVKGTPPETRRLAAIGALFYQHFRQSDGSLVRVPGAWFTSACKRYRAPEATIPAELFAWDATALSLDEIEKQLKLGRRHPAQMELPFASASAVENPTRASEAIRASERDNLPTASHPPGERGTWMDQPTAEALRQRIERDGQRFALRAYIRPGKQAGVFVVVSNWDGIAVSHSTPDAWDQYFAATRACFD